MNTTNIDMYMAIGAKDQHWYAQCRRCFIDLFGIERLPLVCDLFAATSINTSLKSNIALFRRAYREIVHSLPVGAYMPNIRQQIENIRNGKPITGQKITAFSAAMQGDPYAVVVDTWLLRAFEMERTYYRKESNTFRSGGASVRDFELIEFYCREKADKLGLRAAEVSAMIWSGVRIYKGGDTETTYTNLLQFHFNNLFNVI